MMTAKERLGLLAQVRLAVRKGRKAKDCAEKIEHLLVALDGLTRVALLLAGACPQCEGTGSYPPPTRKLCDLCNGRLTLEPEETSAPEPDETSA